MRLPLPAVLLAALTCSNPTAPAGSTDPAKARVVTEDIPRFWAAFDATKSSVDTQPLRAYIDGGTNGLKDFTALRWKTASNLLKAVWAQRDYYQSVRQNTLGVAALEPEIRKSFAIADTLIDDAIFPDVYFTIGWMSTGGTTSGSGLLIGTELFSLAAGSPLSTLSPWQQSVVRSTEILPAIVAHELVHYQQKYGSGKTLLQQAIREGSADFIGRLLAGRTINESLETYGLAHEADLWAEFLAEMHGSDVSRWLYNGGTVTASSTRPADLGYFIGSRIAESYYLKSPNRHAAIQEILNIRNVDAFLAASGYQGKPPG